MCSLSVSVCCTLCVFNKYIYWLLPLQSFYRWWWSLSATTTRLQIYTDFRELLLAWQVLDARKSRWPSLEVVPATFLCMEHLCSRRRPYSLDCHGGAMRMYHCTLENTTDFSCAQNWVSDSDGSRTVSGCEFHRAGPCVKTRLVTFGHNFGKCRSIFKTLSQSDFRRNFVDAVIKTSHVTFLTRSVFRYYLVKLENYNFCRFNGASFIT